MSVEVFGKTISTTLEELVDPRHSALIVWDVQNAQVARWSGQRILQPLADLIDAARQASVLIVYTQHTNLEVARESPARLRWFARRNGITVERISADLPGFSRHFEGTNLWQIHESVRPRPQDIVLKKHRELPTWLEFDALFKSMGIKTVVITGLSSCGGVFPTARCMFSMEYDPIVVRDCVSSDEDALQVSALTIIAAQFELADSKDIIKLWRSAPRRCIQSHK